MAIIKKAKNITIKVKGQYSMIAGTITEVADKITITATKGNLTLSSGKKIIMHGHNGGVKFGEYIPPESKEKIITEIIWMDAEMETQIDATNVGNKISLLVKTENYSEGETITIIIDEIDGKDVNDNVKELTLTGTVDKNGLAELKEEIKI